MELRPYQNEAVEAVERAFSDVRSTLLVLPTGCHALGQAVMSFDNRSERNACLVCVEDVKVNDLLVGADGLPRRVLALHRGESDMYRVVASRDGESYVLTGDHVLVLFDARGGEREITVRKFAELDECEWTCMRMKRFYADGCVKSETFIESVERVGRGEYFGFTVDGDNRYLMHDGTVTHNCRKTIVFSSIAAREVRRGGRVLILAHRGELLEQAADKLRRATGIVAGMEKADITSDSMDEPPYTVVVGSVQSMCREKRLSRFAHDDFSLIVIDECHHALTDTYGAVLRHFDTAKVLGVTATPDRGDLRSLGEVFESIAYEYSIVDAIKSGYLSPIRAQTVPLQIDLTSVQKQGGDYQAAAVGCALDPYLGQIVQEIRERCADRKTVVFTPLIATSIKMLDLLRAAGVEAREVNGDSENRAETLKWFDEAAPGCVILNSMLLTEGWDSPSADCVVVLRATKVRSLFCQMVGRGTRLCPGKKNLLLLDFLWMTQSHDLCRPACLLTDDPEVQAEITRRQEEKAGGEEMDVDAELLADGESDTVRKREEALAKKLEAMRRRKAGLVDPLQYAYSIQDVSLTNYSPSTRRDEAQPTMQQLERLEKMGFGAPATFGEAEILIRQNEERKAAGLTAPKQIRFLEAKGFRNVAKWRAEDAQKMIRRIVVCNWRVPSGVNPETYIP